MRQKGHSATGEKGVRGCFRGYRAARHFGGLRIRVNPAPLRMAPSSPETVRLPSSLPCAAAPWCGQGPRLATPKAAGSGPLQPPGFLELLKRTAFLGRSSKEHFEAGSVFSSKKASSRKGPCV